MSRSRKKTPGWCDRNPWMKRYANRRFRRFKGEVQDGNWYRHYTDPWDICDYKWLYFSKQEVIREIEEWRWWKHHNPFYKYYMK
jgi:hypothetical protein